MTVRAAVHLLLLTALAGTAACAGRSPGQAQPDAPAVLEIRNQSFYDVVIYVLRSGSRFRVGTASGNSTTVLDLPRAVAYPGSIVRFLADPIGGGRTPYSQEMTIRSGELIVLTIPPWA
jgi:hypothetical protein